MTAMLLMRGLSERLALGQEMKVLVVFDHRTGHSRLSLLRGEEGDDGGEDDGADDG